MSGYFYSRLRLVRLQPRLDACRDGPAHQLHRSEYHAGWLYRVDIRHGDTHAEGPQARYDDVLQWYARRSRGDYGALRLCDPNRRSDHRGRGWLPRGGVGLFL